MSKVFVCLFLATFVAASLGMPDGPSSDRQGYCQSGDLYIKEGEREAASLGECVSLHCEDSKVNLFVGERCAVAELKPGCHKTEEDLTKRYPDCCSKVVCGDSNGKSDS